MTNLWLEIGGSLCGVPRAAGAVAAPHTAWTALALLAGLAVCWGLGRWSIPRLARLGGEPLRAWSPRLAVLHDGKQHTPTLGGLFLIGGFLVAVLGCARISEPVTRAAVMAALLFGGWGLADDWLKLRRRWMARRGMPGGLKLAGQVVLAACVVQVLLGGTAAVAPLWTPWGPMAAPNWLALLLAGAAIVGTSNAVNLTDGLDGLACGCSTAVLASLVVLAVGAAGCLPPMDRVSGDTMWQAAVVSAALLGAVVGFLAFNRYPARVFMGDTGALAVGATIGTVAAAMRLELLLLVLGGLFTIEAGSVIVQVGCRRLAGVRPLRCAPLHHHFQHLGWAEPVLVRRFCFVAMFCAVVGVVWAGAVPRASDDGFVAQPAGPMVPAATDDAMMVRQPMANPMR